MRADARDDAVLLLLRFAFAGFRLLYPGTGTVLLQYITGTCTTGSTVQC
jgi:hypothetical protein